MSLNFLSGLLLTAAVLAVLAYIVKELLGDRVGGLGNLRRSLASVLATHVASDAKPVNDHLIGSTGKVVAHADDRARPMRIRLGIELWPARLESPDESRLPVGTAIEVIAVDGPVAVVAAGAGNDAREPS